MTEDDPSQQPEPDERKPPKREGMHPVAFGLLLLFVVIPGVLLLLAALVFGACFLVA